MSEEMPPLLKESIEHSKCEYKRLGKTGLKISVPVMGAMSFGDPKWMPWVVVSSAIELLHDLDDGSE